MIPRNRRLAGLAWDMPLEGFVFTLVETNSGGAPLRLRWDEQGYRAVA